MAYVIYAVIIFIIIAMLFLFSSKWEILVYGSKKKDGERIYSSYDYLKENSIPCKLKRMEHDIFVDDADLILLVKKADLEEARKLLKERE